MYAQVRHPWRTRPVRVIPKGRTCAAGSQLFAVLCLSATFDTTLAGTQQVHPCMLRCAIRGAQGLYALYRKAELPRLPPSPHPDFRSALVICHFRYNARRHAASTSMYAQVRHPWRTRPVRVIPKGRTCAAGFLLFAVLCLSGTFDTTLAGTQQVHPCMFRCAILGAQGLYALYRKAELALLAPSSQLSAPSSQLPALNFSNNNPSKT